MPEGKITRQRMRDHLRRLWMVYLAGMLALALANHLVYTVTRPSYSEDETLKIMLLNVDVSIDEEALLKDVQRLGFRTVETVPLYIALEDPASEMLLAVQLTGGFGDIYITDAQGLAALEARNACRAVRFTSGSLKLAVAENGTNPESATAALEPLAEKLGE